MQSQINSGSLDNLIPENINHYIQATLQSNNQLDSVSLPTYPEEDKTFNNYINLLNEVGYYIVKLDKNSIGSYITSNNLDPNNILVNFEKVFKILKTISCICPLVFDDSKPSSETEFMIVIPKVITNKNKLITFKQDILSKGLVDSKFQFVLFKLIMKENYFWDIVFGNLQNQINETISINNLISKLLYFCIKRVIFEGLYNMPFSFIKPPEDENEFARIKDNFNNKFVNSNLMFNEGVCVDSYNLYSINGINNTSPANCPVPAPSSPTPITSTPTPVASATENIVSVASCPAVVCSKPKSPVGYIISIVCLLFIVAGLGALTLLGIAL